MMECWNDEKTKSGEEISFLLFVSHYSTTPLFHDSGIIVGRP